MSRSKNGHVPGYFPPLRVELLRWWTFNPFRRLLASRLTASAKITRFPLLKGGGLATLLPTEEFD